jgi:hypothetical protein
MTNFVLVPPAPASKPARKPTGQIKTSVQRDYLLLDCSPSMIEDDRRGKAFGGVNAYIRKLADAGVSTKITVAVFGHDYEVIRKDMAPTSCEPITNDDAALRGGTALNDAIGRLVAQAKTDNPDRAALVIMTDGEENCSKELSTGQAHALLTQCRLRGWQVLFVGIDHDNTALAQRYGATARQCISIVKEDIASVMARVADKRTAYGQTRASIEFSASEKEDLGKFLIGK